MPQPVSAAALSGRELLQGIVDGKLPPAAIGGPMRFRLVEVGEGRAVFEGEPDASLLNPMGTVHGGWALTLIDSATACAAHTTVAAGHGTTTVETKANFVRPIPHDIGRVRCEGQVVHAGRTLVTTEARVMAPDGRLLAHGTSTVMVIAPRG